MVEGRGVLSSFDDPGTDGYKSLYLGLHRAFRDEVDVQSVLGDLRFRNLHEVHRGRGLLALLEHLELVPVPLDGVSRQRRRPELRLAPWVKAVDDHREERQGHPRRMVAILVAQGLRTQRSRTGHSCGSPPVVAMGRSGPETAVVSSSPSD